MIHVKNAFSSEHVMVTHGLGQITKCVLCEREALLPHQHQQDTHTKNITAAKKVLVLRKS